MQPWPLRYDQRFLVEVTMRRCLGERNLADELRDHVRADGFIDQHLKEAVAHRLLGGEIDGDVPFGACGIEDMAGIWSSMVGLRGMGADGGEDVDVGIAFTLTMRKASFGRM